jgi:hypothetical protein
MANASKYTRNRAVPVGYKLSVVPFEKGNPVASPDNKTAAVDILANADNSACPENCFRPVGIAFDRQGRLFLSSDTTGEIYVVTRAQQLNHTERNTMESSPSDPSSASSAFKKTMNFRMGISSLALLIFFTMC